MSEVKGKYIAGDIVSEGMDDEGEDVRRLFGRRWNIFLDLCRDIRYGRIEIIIQDGHVQKIGGLTWFK